MVRNTAIVEKTGLQSVSAIIDARRTALFGHVARLDDRVPARYRLRLAIDVRSGMPPNDEITFYQAGGLLCKLNVIAADKQLCIGCR